MNSWWTVNLPIWIWDWNVMLQERVNMFAEVSNRMTVCIQHLGLLTSELYNFWANYLGFFHREFFTFFGQVWFWRGGRQPAAIIRQLDLSETKCQPYSWVLMRKPKRVITMFRVEFELARRPVLSMKFELTTCHVSSWHWCRVKLELHTTAVIVFGVKFKVGAAVVTESGQVGTCYVRTRLGTPLWSIHYDLVFHILRYTVQVE